MSLGPDMYMDQKCGNSLVECPRLSRSGKFEWFFKDLYAPCVIA